MPHLHHGESGLTQSVLFTLILAFTALIYLRGCLSLRVTGKKVVSGWRAFSFLGGLFLIWIALASPIAALDHELLTIHMVQHLLLMTFAPPLIWLGAPVDSLLHGLPHRIVETLLAPLRQSRTVKRIVEIMGKPRFGLLAASAVLVGWHIPALFALGMQSAPWHIFEHLSFLATGLLFWWPVIQPRAGGHDLSMILYLFFATLPCDILSGFLVFSERVAYPIYFSSWHLLGFTPLVDQQCAAALMWTCVTVVYLVAGAILTMCFLSPRAFPRVDVIEPKLRATEFGQRASQSLEVI
jgi:cytochrome c oxidase assembly factor CtaG